ncbi:MAG TPA: TonB family protein [Vicinamibacteria bacterium]|nr:TonB family protein [Vicinamibacteria bacterium]
MPRTIGRYQVQESIGFGAMGAVYKAFDPLIKRTLAIKTLRLDIPRTSPQYKSFIDRFYHEARISGTLSHPNIVTLFDIGEEGGVPYLAMEFVEGDTLASILEKGARFNPERVISLVSQIASAVDYAHSKGVIHRDIKPSNLILYQADRVKVTDFGIAKLADAEMTQSGTLLGTPAYMSPEQAMGEKLDGRSDIFSLGVCAFEMLSGEQPFAGPNVTAILYKLVHVEPIEPANLEMNGLVPHKWREVFGKVLAKKPDDRYQTATEFVQDLEYCLGSWFGSAMLDTLVDEDAGAAVRAAAEAASAQVAAREAGEAPAPPPVPERFDEATAALPRPDDLAPEDDVPATLLMNAALPTPADTDTMPVAPQETGPTMLLPAQAAPAAKTPPAEPAPPAEPPAGPTMLIPSPAFPEKTVRMPAGGAPAPRRAARSAATPPDNVVEAPPTVLMPAATPWRPAAPRPAAPPARPAATVQTAEMPAGAGRAATRGGSGRALLLAAGALVLLIAVAGVGALVLVKGGDDVAATQPLPEAAPTAPPPAPAAGPPSEPVSNVPSISGLVRVATQPAGATVIVDGEPRGSAPVEVPELALGAHEVRVELRGYAPAVQKVILTAEAPQSDVNLTLSRSAPPTVMAELHSSPQGALVLIDGIAVGQTPLRHPLRVGTHAVEMTREGFEPWTGSFDVGPRVGARVDAALRPVARAKPTPEPVDVTRVHAPGEVDTQPRRLSGGSAPYPDKAPRLRPGRDVTVAGTFVVTEEGEIADVRITESAGDVVDAAVMAAVRDWKYAPGAKRGVKVKVRVPFKQTFRAG